MLYISIECQRIREKYLLTNKNALEINRLNDPYFRFHKTPLNLKKSNRGKKQRENKIKKSLQEKKQEEEKEKQEM